ncbi:voltage-dependent calcium channel subunit alpha-2/delta-3 isoform X1 [Harmonia axyridis]|uniref:voltage-dependent calcium channel subunit alpha-2/delta-3 isoform X1 n=1 Tax=Harmonia axyridis TaxID=115357 RepID=UPI001E27650A|nr:voltage-dependent calcium channel subunit alpha-2/delta-3 isoform X1 [Harmonia axyridis]
MWFEKYKLFSVILTFSLLVIVEIFASSQGRVVGKWANTLGRDLWDLGGRITKYSEIEQRYHLLNAQVEEKDPMDLLDNIVEVITRMMDRKMDAVQCIVHMAENKSETFEYDKNITHYYYNSKYSPIQGQNSTTYDLKVLNDNLYRYKTLTLNEDTHFYNIPVNTTHSSVHVPTQIFDLHEDPAVAIQWSEALDKVFIQNYQSDPSLTWQYFGSYSGIMRHYPAKSWPSDTTDLFDCRIRTWFIEAATCTKDIIILLDNSGSMDAMGKHLGVLTASSILDTLSNNDYVNILNYTDGKSNYTIECFKDLLVQATEENIKVFKDELQKLKPMNKTDITVGLETAFQLLAHYRENIRHCDGITTFCNQAIMIITDGLNKNFSDIVLKYDFLYNGTYKPVRIFSYLVGQETTNEEEIKWMSCATKGYYVHIQAIEQVTFAVLEYINVIARPLILQEDDHPVSWTHVYMDETYNDDLDSTINEPYRMLTSAAAPAFDKKKNRGTDNSTRIASLLGVAATDVPIENIARLTLPYRIGVSGYAFIVSNNGYVLMHPDLRPMVGNHKMYNYNSIDLTEVEQFYTVPPLPPRELPERLLELRSMLINGSKGIVRDVPLKYYYDRLRRVSVEVYDYYFSPLINTPFTLALAIPKSHGYSFLRVDDEIDRNRHTGNELTDFFKGNNWKIHPKWVYCKYHYLEGHEFPNAETELLHFLGRMYDQNFKWRNQYEASVKTGDFEKEDLGKVECGRKSLKEEDYYCDKKLIERLIFDARNTQASFDETWGFMEGEENLFDRYAVKMRFVATMSGLTRWEYKNDSAIDDAKEFGELHSRAIDERWYKSAVLQHQYDKESFVYAIADNEDNEEHILVTGSYAIFPKDKGTEAPGSVVGFQFGQKELRQRFREITTKPSNDCPQCSTCVTLTCYIVDNSGYILVANNENFAGQFFGEIEGDVMESMLEEQIYEEVIIYDYQALCDIQKKTYKVTTPAPKSEKQVPNQNPNNKTEGAGAAEEEEEIEDHFFPCDNEVHLYVLKQHLLRSHKFTGEFKAVFENKVLKRREYYVKTIPHSNLILVAINNSYGKASDVIFTTRPKFVQYDVNFPCYKIELNNLPRGAPRGCYFKNDKENEIMACGRAAKRILHPLIISINLCVFFILIVNIIR